MSEWMHTALRQTQKQSHQNKPRRILHRRATRQYRSTHNDHRGDPDFGTQFLEDDLSGDFKGGVEDEEDGEGGVVEAVGHGDGFEETGDLRWGGGVSIGVEGGQDSDVALTRRNPTFPRSWRGQASRNY